MTTQAPAIIYLVPVAAGTWAIPGRSVRFRKLGGVGITLLALAVAAGLSAPMSKRLANWFGSCRTPHPLCRSQ